MAPHRDRVVVATLDPPEPILTDLGAQGIPRGRLVPLRTPSRDVTHGEDERLRW